MLDITEAANVSKRTFYLHFTDKEALIEALALRGFQELRTRVEAEEHHIGGLASFRTDFLRITEIIFDYAEKNPDLMQIIFGTGGSFRLQALTREFMVRAWEENMEAKCTYIANAPVPPRILANAIVGVVHQLLCWWVQHPNTYSPADMAQMCTSVLFNSIEVNYETTAA